MAFDIRALTVVTGARVGGRYQSVELSAKSEGFQFSQTVAAGECSSYGPPTGIWSWTPSTPGDYHVEFRVRILSGEAQRDTTNDAITQIVSVR